MSPKKKSWREKLLDAKDLPKQIPVPEKLQAKHGRGMMVLPAPVEVDAMMKKARKGKLLTIDQIRQALANKHQTNTACAMVTGIFAWIAAHAAAEALEAGRSRVTPYWRTLKTGGEINPKYPGGIEDIRARLEAEGHRIRQRGKRYFVEAFETKLSPLED